MERDAGLKGHELLQQVLLEPMALQKCHAAEPVALACLVLQGNVGSVFCRVDFQPAGQELTVEIAHAVGAVLDRLAQGIVPAMVEHVAFGRCFREVPQKVLFGSGRPFNDHIAGTDNNWITGYDGEYKLRSEEHTSELQS